MSRFPRVRNLLFAAAILTALPLAAVAQSEPVRGGSLRVAITGDPPAIDPHISTAVIVLEISSHVLEMLYARDADGLVQPMLASALPDISADGLTVTIPLREGVIFHDGSSLDAADVVASLERWQRIGTGRTYLAKAESIEAVDDLTVRIQLSEPAGILTSVLGFTESGAVVFSSEQLEAAGDNAIDDPIGTGPYRLREWLRGQRVVVERFDDYTGLSSEPSGDAGAKNAWLDEIHFIAVPDAATRQAGLESGEFDVNYRASASDLEYIESSDNMYVWVMRPGYNYIGLINHASPLMQNLQLRQAIQAVTDVYPLMLGAFGNDAVFSVGPSIVPREYGIMYNDTAGADLYNQADPERAAELLAASGYQGETVRLLTSRDYDYQYRGTLILSDQLGAIGIQTDIIVRDWATTVSLRSDPSAWDIFLGNFTVAPEPELMAYVNPNYLNSYTGSEAYASALAELRQTTDADARTEVWAHAQEAFYEDVGALQLANSFLLNGYASDVHVQARYFLFQAWNTWKD